MACLPLFLSFCLSSFAPVFASFYAGCPSLLWLSFFVLLHCLCGSLGVVVVSFSLAVYTQKRAQFSCVLSCPVVCLLCEIWLAVLVKFVIVSLNLFGDTFIGNCIFIIVSPLLEKAFEDTLNKIPRVKFVLYALLYVV